MELLRTGADAGALRFDRRQAAGVGEGTNNRMEGGRKMIRASMERVERCRRAYPVQTKPFTDEEILKQLDDKRKEKQAVNKKIEKRVQELGRG